jgi:flagellar hook-basal body complex protein FliE
MDYGSIISKVIPGTFVPDLGAADKPNVGPIPAGGIAPVDASQGPSFKDTITDLLSDVNTKINTSDQNQRDLATGKTNDLGKVVTSVEEANLALNYTMAMRQKLLDAYQEISRMQI